jgi:glycosyltransferase involved in cell wall biosynthesis
MHLAVDAVGAKYGGAATILLDFLGAVLADKRVHRVTVFCSLRSLRRFDLPDYPKLVQQEQPGAETPIQRILWHEIGLGRACDRIQADVVFCISNAGRGTRHVPHVTLIQQSLPFSTEALRTLRSGERLRMRIIRESMKRSCMKACRVIVQTPVMAEWLSSAFGLTRDCIEVSTPISTINTQNGHDAAVLDNMRAVPENCRFLYVGNDEPYKKVETIVTGLQIIRSQMPEAHLFLTLPTTCPYSRMPGVVCLGYLEPNVLYQAYALATALVLPSLTETVGLPLLEAMQMGTPVIASDRPYAHSMCEDAALYFDPYNASGFARQAIDLMQNMALHKQLVESGSRLIQRRITARPYEQIVDILCECAHKA